MSVELKQSVNLPTEKMLDQSAHWIMILPANVPKTLWLRVPYGETIRRFRERLHQPENNEALVQDLPNTMHTRLSHACVTMDICSFKLLGLARKLVDAHLRFRPKTLSIMVMGFDGEHTERLTEALITAALAAVARLPEFKQKKDKAQPLKQIRVYGCSRGDGFARTFAANEGNTLARRLSMLPSNKLEPFHYRKEVEKLAKAKHWNCEFIGINELKKRKCGAFLAVSQGSASADAGIIHLRYRPAGKNRKTLALVGKGICYDTGGNSLKPPRYMFGMHEDMLGSAVALGTFLALSELRVDFAMDCWLALAMNHIGPKAYKPNDVVTASDGTNIEVVNTDAEGRMVLADTLVMASKAGPRLIIDYATLTGSCVHALGTAYSGVFSNRNELLPVLIEAGSDSGERVWPFPLDEDFDEAIKSTIADVKQRALEAGPDHIQASRFLQRFVKNETPWVHVDLSAMNNKGGLAHIPTDSTGFGVRFSLDLILDKDILEKVKKSE